MLVPRRWGLTRRWHLWRRRVVDDCVSGEHHGHGRGATGRQYVGVLKSATASCNGHAVGGDGLTNWCDLFFASREEGRKSNTVGGGDDGSSRRPLTASSAESEARLSARATASCRPPKVSLHRAPSDPAPLPPDSSAALLLLGELRPPSYANGTLQDLCRTLSGSKRLISRI